MKQRKLLTVAFAVVMATLVFVGVRVFAAGPNVGTNGSSAIYTGAVNASGGVYANGGVSALKLGAPSAPTVTNVGTAGTTTYTYYCASEDINGGSTVSGDRAPSAYAGESVASASGSTTTGNATLSTTNYNTVFCPGQTGAVAFRVFKADTSHSLGVCFTQSGQGCSVVDNTTGAGTAYTSNTLDQTGMIYGGRLNCGGSVKVVAGTIEVTAPCISAYTQCEAAPSGYNTTPVAGAQANCTPTSTATVINSATVTVGAVVINTAGTPSPSPVVNWWAGPQ